MVALLLQHSECPGFTGEPLGEIEWAELLLETARIQHGAAAAADWPKPDSGAPATVS